MSQVDADAVKNEARRRIHSLVEDYMRVLAAGRKESFNEERVKIAFIVPMLEALGWNPRTDEVLPEQATLTGRADFGLRVGGRTKIFVEMKRFSKSLDGHYTVKGRPRSFAEQAIQYAWGMKASWAVLTNFEETRLYDSHVKKPEDGLVWKKSIRFTEYESRFDELWLVSRQSVVSGALDAYKAKIERPPVDKAFIEDLMNCRQLLADDIRNHNPELTYDQINESVQKILDRLIFIKNCEDRLIIPAESLWKRYKAWQETAIDKEIVIFMMDLKNLFRYFDQVYNGKLFEKHPCEDLKISNEVFEEIIDTLYGDGQHLGYNFSVIPVDVLGQAYELYIGSIIKEKEGHTKAVEIVKKPAKRKAHGIYYTPEPIVDYIVRSTLGKVLEECKTPEDVSRIKVLDPACGSGSFLIKAFDVIKEWYENYNKLNRPISVPGTLDAHIVPVPNPEERILTENLYGVDLDPQAVEITILNLSLKAIKTKEKLPYIADHIKCGNSLISDEKIAGDKAFKWNEEFEEIMKEGGFDVIIGNPPYIRIQRIPHNVIDYLFENYSTPIKKSDISLIFIEKAHKLLAKNGLLGFICSSQWMYTDYGERLREYLAEGYLREIVNFGSLPVFSHASTYPAIFLISKSPGEKLTYRKILSKNQLSLHGIQNSETKEIRIRELDKAAWSFSDFSLIDHLETKKIQYVPLSQIGHFYIGTLTGMDEVFVVDSEKILRKKIEKEIVLPYAYRGKEIVPFRRVVPHAKIIYPYLQTKEGNSVLIDEHVLKEEYPNTYRYLLQFKEKLTRRKDSRKFYAKGNQWFRFLRPGRWTYITREKLLIKGVAKVSCVGYLDKNTAFNGANCPALILDNTDPIPIMGILNSSLITYYLRSVCPLKLQGYRRFNANNLNNIPIPQGRGDLLSRIAILTQELMELSATREGKRTPFETEQVERQIRHTKDEIDELVFDLYSLSARVKATVVAEVKSVTE